MSNFLTGETVVDSITIVNAENEAVDITNLVSSLDLFEGIDQPFVSGRISVIDSLNLIDEYKINGQESCTIRYRVKRGLTDFSGGKEQVEKVFRIYKVDNIRQFNDKTYTYVLRMADPKFFTAERVRVSKVHRGSYSEILLQTLQNEAQFDELPAADQLDFWEKTEPGNIQFISPNYTIKEFIKYCTRNANKESKAVYKNGMFFYQTLLGGFKFMSIDTMLKDLEFPLTFSHIPRTQDLEQEEIDQDSEFGQGTTILSFKHDKRANILEGVRTGGYSGTQLVYDPIRKLEKTVTFDLKKNFDEKGKGHLSGFPPIRFTEDSEKTRRAEDMILDDEPMTITPTQVELPLNEDYLIGGYLEHKVSQTNAYSDSKILQDDSQFIGNEYLDNAELERNALQHTLNSNVVYLEIPARTDLFPGVVINVSLPSGGVDSFENVLNDGKYLITQIRHTIVPIDSRGVMSLRCVKESYADKFENQKLLKDYEGPRAPEKGEV